MSDNLERCFETDIHTYIRTYFYQNLSIKPPISVKQDKKGFYTLDCYDRHVWLNNMKRTHCCFRYQKWLSEGATTVLLCGYFRFCL